MTILKKTLILLALPLLLSGCASYKKSVYLRHDQVLNDINQNGRLFEFRIAPKDELTITVSTSDPEASAPFYRKIGQTRNQSGSTQGIGNAKLLDYLVDNNGYIDFPVLGMLKVVGLTNRECEALIRNRLQSYLNEVPNVTVRIANFKVSVLGEVGNPGIITVTDERINIFQALAQAGDMTLFADRDDVQLLREDSVGRRHIIHLDLTEAGITLAPEYYLQQNDIIYVKPTKAKVHANTFSSNASIWISLLSLATALASLAIIAFQ